MFHIVLALILFNKEKIISLVIIIIIIIVCNKICCNDIYIRFWPSSLVLIDFRIQDSSQFKQILCMLCMLCVLSCAMSAVSVTRCNNTPIILSCCAHNTAVRPTFYRRQLRRHSVHWFLGYSGYIVLTLQNHEYVNSWSCKLYTK